MPLSHNRAFHGCPSCMPPWTSGFCTLLLRPASYFCICDYYSSWAKGVDSWDGLWSCPEVAVIRPERKTSSWWLSPFHYLYLFLKVEVCQRSVSRSVSKEMQKTDKISSKGCDLGLLNSGLKKYWTDCYSLLTHSVYLAYLAVTVLLWSERYRVYLDLQGRA